MNTTIVIGMSCPHCTKAVTEAVSSVAGVSNVNVSLADGIVTWDGDASLADAVKKAILNTGFEVK